MNAQSDVIIVGGGLAGLTCARHLTSTGLSCCLLEAADAIGGRVRTDEVDGFRLDRGFQVFLTAYPEAGALLDYRRLRLGRFEPGALVRFRGRFHRLSDPWRRPGQLLATALSPAASLRDKLRVARFRRATTRCSLDTIYARPERTTSELLQAQGFSPVITERFFRPFLGGIFLDRQLQTSSRMCEFVFRMFSLGDAALPAGGMEEIPRQLAVPLPAGVVRTGTPVAAVDGNTVITTSGERLVGRAVVIAADAPAVRLLLQDPTPAPGCSVACLYFAAPIPPVRRPILILNGDGAGPVNNLCVPSEVTPGYAPPGQSLVSVTVLPPAERDDHWAEPDELARRVTTQLTDWFGQQVEAWRLLRTYHIPYALPRQSPPALQPVAKPVQLREGWYVCGDHCDTASINGAMASGRRAAESVCQALTAP
jgi:phytoene dehydrogenase-like protein